jgi:Fic family protein
MASPSHAIPYELPSHWIRHDATAIVQYFVDAKAAILSLKAIPHQRDWVEQLQKLQLKMEVAGTSRIEGADFTDRELEIAMDVHMTTKDLVTRSQRQARAAAETYRWIAAIPDDRPITEELVLDIHRRIVTGCDDDHCAPGRIRNRDENVTFGFPRHRGCEGGPACQRAFSEMIRAVQHEYRSHDPLLQAMSLHYHFAAMHPFLDGNGRTARAIEALVLQRAGLRDTAFIAMSNYYYEERSQYLDVLASVRAAKHDPTLFINFGLRGIAIQCNRLFGEIRHHIQVAVYRNVMYDLFNHLKSPKCRVIAARQIAILKMLLATNELDLREMIGRTTATYGSLQNANKARIRDINELIALGAIHAQRVGQTWIIRINLNWPQEITEGDFMDRVSKLPKSKMHSFL